MTPPIATTPQIDQLLNAHAVVAIGVSGGKDSDAAAFATVEHLVAIGHQGPCVLIHSDLGKVEWPESLPQCERLAQRLGLPLITVQRAAGGLMERWLSRWDANCARYASLSCVRLILPWSTASMRFCTSELKTAIICRELVRRFPGQTIVSVAGIRREESDARAKAEITKPQNKLTSVKYRTTGLDWLPIANWTLADVVALHEARGFPMHTTYQTNSRVSCMFCILGSQADLLATTSWQESHELYRELVDLEIASTFGFQDAHWLGDLAPHLLSNAQQAGIAEAKRKAAERTATEAPIPAHLLYVKGWPTCIPTIREAQQLADIRRKVASLIGLPIGYTDAAAVRNRFAELMTSQGKEPREYPSLVRYAQRELIM